MNDNNLFFTDPWLHKSTRDTQLPRNAEFVCAYELDVIPFTDENALYFQRTDARDELWLAAGQSLTLTDSDGKPVPLQGIKGAERVGCAGAGPNDADKVSSCLNLFDELVRSMVGFGWPQKFLLPGILDEAAFGRVVGRLERELEENKQRAQEGETEIVRVARNLGLNPEPAGTTPNLWLASCPGGGPRLEINAAVNEFWCPWCKRTGGPEELRTFARERRL